MMAERWERVDDPLPERCIGGWLVRTIVEGALRTILDRLFVKNRVSEVALASLTSTALIWLPRQSLLCLSLFHFESLGSLLGARERSPS